MRAGREREASLGEDGVARRDHPRVAGGRARLDEDERVSGVFPEPSHRSVDVAVGELAENVRREDELGGLLGVIRCVSAHPLSLGERRYRGGLSEPLSECNHLGLGVEQREPRDSGPDSGGSPGRAPGACADVEHRPGLPAGSLEADSPEDVLDRGEGRRCPVGGVGGDILGGPGGAGRSCSLRTVGLRQPRRRRFKAAPIMEVEEPIEACSKTGR